MTAEGVLRGIRLAVRRAYGSDLDGMTVAIQGVGHVGGFLADKLAAAGARLVLTDINAELLSEVAARTGGQAVAPEAIFDAKPKCSPPAPSAPC